MKNRGIFLSLASALLVLVICAYSNHFDNGFHFDDSHVIENNVSIRSFDIVKYFSDTSTFSILPANQAYRPLFTTILALEYWAGNGKPFWFHVGAFFCYALLGALLFVLFRRIFTLAQPKKDHSIIALLSAGFYLLHTAHAETVNYLSAGSDLFSTTLMVLAMIIYSLWPRLRKFGFYILPAALAILTKEVSAIFPLFLLIYLFFERSYATKSNRTKAAHPLVAIIPTALVSLALLVLSSKMLPETFMPSIHSRIAYMLAQPFVLLHYFNSFFLPFNLSADTDWETISNVFDDRVLIGLVFILSLISLSIWAWRDNDRRPIGFGVCWFLVGVLPTSSGIVILSEVMNDHRMFLPFIGLTMVVAWVINLFLEKYADIMKRFLYIKAAFFATTAMIFAAHAYGTYQRNVVWKNEDSLWYDVTLKSPKNGRGLMNYGLTLMAKGQTEMALDYFERALVYAPKYAHLHINIGIARNVLGDIAKAEEHFKKALQYNPNFYGCYFYYAGFLDKKSRHAEAIELLAKAIDLAPNFLESRYLLMRIHDNSQDFDRLRQAINETLKRWPNDATAKLYDKKAQKNSDFKMPKMADSFEHNLP